MPLVDRGRLRLFRFDSIPSNEVVHGVFTRRGGLSPDPWASLNLGAGVGDEPDRVRDNRRLVLESLGREPGSLFDVWQVHSAEVVIAGAPRRGDPLRKADAILTDRPEVTLMMRFADCVPIVLFDPVRRAVGLVHAGWQGTVRRTAAAAVGAMVDAFGTRPADLWAGLGPSIAAHHYPVGPEVVEAVQRAFGDSAETHLRRADGQVRLDLWSANAALLHDEGVRSLEVSGLCTACAIEDWYSHRAEHGRTGRFGAVIGLR